MPPQQQAERPFLTDGGLETVLIFHRGIDLPEFASFDLLGDEEAGGRCARDQPRHPTHFAGVLADGGDRLGRKAAIARAWPEA